MLWTDDSVKLLDNYYSSLIQFKSLEQRLSRNLSLKEQYSKTVRDDLEKGYIIEVEKHDPNCRTPREWYLPHHPVVNPHKPGKVRRVLNGASKFHGHSLNNALLIGPDLLQNLLHVLLRFRKYIFALSADIEGMFLQVGVPEKDQRSLRFLWRGNPTEPVSVFQYTRHVFGAKDSPTCANFALLKTAVDNETEYPEAALAVQQNFYMDDLLVSVQSESEAFNLSKQLVTMLKLGGFNLTKFVSNIHEFANELNSTNNDAVEPVKDISNESSDTSHVLGLKWEYKHDTLKVRRGISSRDWTKPITQRIVLSVVSAVFDPIGLIIPYTIKARLLLKEIWRLNCQRWDDLLPEDISHRFLEWCSALPKLEQFSIQRSFFPGIPEDIELHVFGDSSAEVFCAVAYLRGKIAGATHTNVSFVFAKARVAPMKTLSVPKLELQAALLAARLSYQVKQALTLDITRTFLWTDSTIVVQWLNSSKKHPTFVANRVAEILENSTVDQWFHVDTDRNPADAGTRGLTIDALRESNWLLGPEFLKTLEWPFIPNIDILLQIKQSTDKTDEHQLPIVASVFSGNRESNMIFNWERYSSFSKLVRITVYILRLHLNRRHNRTNAIEDPFELEEAELKLFFVSQREAFSNEFDALQKQQNISKSSRIVSLSPFVGPNGVLRCTGRTRRLNVSDFDAKHPIILDGRHPLVKLFVHHLHALYCHQGSDYVRAQLQQRFFILRIRSLLRSVKSDCFVCRKRKAETLAPMMADLPIERLGYRLRPFSNCGVDYFGPFHVAVRRSTEKRWCFLFTCLTTRSIHIEVVPSLDASSCVMGIERFISRRGQPSVICSDNGTNFVGADKEFLLCVENWNKKAPSLLAHRKLKWKFNPAGAPHHGGSWERMVRSCKQVLYVILGSRRLTDEVLQTSLCLTEQFLNARPLTTVSNDPTEIEALTPNHFLLGGPCSSFPSLDSCEINHRKRYARAQAYADSIWTRWLRDYTPSLNKRSKWYSPSDRELKVNDLVWIVDAQNPRGYYPLGRILSLKYGIDGIARSADVRTKTGTYNRPVVKLVPVIDSTPLLRPEDVANAKVSTT